MANVVWPSVSKQIASVVSLHRNDKIRMASFLAMTRLADKNRVQELRGKFASKCPFAIKRFVDDSKFISNHLSIKREILFFYAVFCRVYLYVWVYGTDFAYKKIRRYANACFGICRFVFCGLC